LHVFACQSHCCRRLRLEAFTFTPPLGALGQTLPAARSGKTYLWTLKGDGGKPLSTATFSGTKSGSG